MSGSSIGGPLNVNGAVTVQSTVTAQPAQSSSQLTTLGQCQSLFQPIGSSGGGGGGGASISSFGGSTTNSNNATAISNAVATGQTIYFGPGTYIVNGELDLSGNVSLVGVPGQTIFTRNAQGTTGQPCWIYFSSGAVNISGIIFDGNTSLNTVDANGIVVGSSVTFSGFYNCVFKNILGPTPYINGLTYYATTSSQNYVGYCEFSNNQGCGLNVNEIGGIVIEYNEFNNNIGTGLLVDIQDPNHVLTANNVHIVGNIATGNAVGIQVGDASIPGSTNPTYVYGTVYMRVLNSFVLNNNSSGNTGYEMVVSGSQNIIIQGNNIGPGGIDCNCSQDLTILDNYIDSNGSTAGIGLDIGGSDNVKIINNTITGFTFCCTPGGTQNTLIENNTFNIIGAALAIERVEQSGQGNALGLICANLVIRNNLFTGIASTNKGILCLNGPSGLVIENNNFTGTSSTNCLIGLYQNSTVEGNKYNSTLPVISAATDLIFNDVFNSFVVSFSTDETINNLQNYNYSTLLSSQINLIQVTNGGSGYSSSTTATISDPTGTGATLDPIVYNGVLLGINVNAVGSNYTNPTVVITDTAGTGAAAIVIAPIDINFYSQKQKVSIFANSANSSILTFASSSSIITQNSFNPAIVSYGSVDAYYISNNSWFLGTGLSLNTLFASISGSSSQVFDVANGTIGNQAINFAQFNSTVSLLDTDISALQTDIGTINTDITNIDGSITTLFTDIGTINTNISALQTDIGTINADIGTINTDITNIDGSITTLFTDIGTINTDIGTINTNVSALQTDIGTINTDIGTINTNISALQTDIGTINTNISALQTDIGTINTDIGTINTDIGTINTDITNIDGSITTLFTDIGTINTNISAVQTDIGTINTNISALQTDIGTINTDIGTINTDIGTINTNVSALQTDIGTINTDITNIDGSITTLYNDIGIINTSLSALPTIYANIAGNSTLTFNVADGTTLNEAINFTQFSTTISSVNGNLSALTNDISTINSDITNIDGSINTLLSDVGNINTEIGTINTDIGTINTTLSALPTTYALLNGSTAQSFSAFNLTAVNSVNAKIIAGADNLLDDGAGNLTVRGYANLGANVTIGGDIISESFRVLNYNGGNIGGATGLTLSSEGQGGFTTSWNYTGGGETDIFLNATGGGGGLTIWQTPIGTTAAITPTTLVTELMNLSSTGSLTTTGPISGAIATASSQAVMLSQLQNESLEISVSKFTTNYNISGFAGTLPDTGLTIGWNYTSGGGEVDLFLGPQGGSGGLRVYQLNVGGTIGSSSILYLSGTGSLTIPGELSSASISNSGTITSDSLTITGTATIDGASSTGGNATFLTGINFNSYVATSPQDLSHGINMWGATYGFNITDSNLNYNVNPGANHSFYQGGNLIATINGSGLTANISDSSAIPSSGNTLETVSTLLGSYVQKVANIATLRAFTSTSPTNDVFVEGYNSISDGGEGIFTYNNSDTTSGSLFTGSIAPVNSPSAPTLSSVAGGTNAATTFYVKTTYVTFWGETVASTEASLAVAADYLLVVDSPVAETGALYWNVYVSESTGTETLQASNLTIGTNWTAPATLVAGVSPPTTSTAGAVLTVSAVTNGTIVTFNIVSGSGVSANTQIVYNITGSGNTGTYLVTISQTVASTTLTSDNGGTIIVDLAGRRWYRQATQISKQLDLFWFGAAVSNADNYTPLTAALSVIAQAPKAGIEFGQGSFKFSREISISLDISVQGLSLKGKGQNNTLLIWAGTSNGLSINLNNESQGIEIVDLTISTFGTGYVGLTLINTQTTGTLTQSSVRNVTFIGSNVSSNGWATHLLNNGLSNMIYSNCLFHGYSSTDGSVGLDIRGPSTSQINIVENITNCGFYSLGTGLLYDINTQGVTVSQTNFTNLNYGISSSPVGGAGTGGTQLGIINSQFGNCALASIYYPPVSGGFNCIFMTGNLIYVNANSSGLLIGQGLNLCTIVGNSFSGASTSIGINITEAVSSVNVIDANIFSTFETAIQLMTNSLWTVGPSNVFTGCTNNIINAPTLEIYTPVQTTQNYLSTTSSVSNFVAGSNIGIAPFVANMPSGYTNWLLQLGVNGSTYFHIDGSGNANSVGTISASTISASTNITAPNMTISSTINTGNLYASNIVRGNGFLSYAAIGGVSGLALTCPQNNGITMGWNYTDGQGETDFFLNASGGGGGLYIYQTKIGTAVTTPVPSGDLTLLSTINTGPGGGQVSAMGYANNITIAGSNTGTGPTITSSGSDTNVDINYVAKGTGFHKFNATVKVSGPANNLFLEGGATGGPVLITTQGSDTNINIAYQAKGTGGHNFLQSMTVDGNIVASGLITTTGGTFSAAGTTFATATQMTAQYNIVTGGTGGVILPDLVQTIYYVFNDTGSAITVYTPGGTSLGSVAAGQTTSWYCFNSTSFFAT